MGDGLPSYAVRLDHCTLMYDHVSIFDNLSMDFQQHQWMGVLGPSGIGKTTLIKMIAGLIQPKSGTMKRLFDVTYLPQDLMLLPWLTIQGNVWLGNHLRGKITQETKNKAKQLLIQLGIEEVFHSYYPHQLSGGMQKRVALCRVLLEDCPIILLDEPLSSLDVPRKVQLYHLLRHIFQDKTVIIITHDPKDVMELCHQVMVMRYDPLSSVPKTITTTYILKGDPGHRSLTYMSEEADRFIQMMTTVQENKMHVP